MKNSDLQQLFYRYLSGDASPEDIKLLLRLFGKTANEDILRSLIRHQLDNEENDQSDADRKLALTEAYSTIKEQIEQEKRAKKGTYSFAGKYSWKKYAAAAAVALLIVSSFLLLRHSHESTALREVAQAQDVAPGGNKAILTLANGEKIILDSAKQGLLSFQGSTKVIKPGNGLLTYNSGSVNADKQIRFNTITTPRGGQYEIILSDGTKVWLNAASSLRYPTAFTGNKRIVEVTGEAYFEVKTDKDRPFFVKLPASIGNDRAEVKVLGTHFDVRTYKEEPVAKVTLLEGSVKVTKGKENMMLQPGEQAQIDRQGNMAKADDIDLQGSVAWTNNYFYFEDDDIHAVMSELARWYDVNIVIRGNIPQHFGGYISRDIYMSKMFEALQATGHLEYKIRGDTIVVSP